MKQKYNEKEINQTLTALKPLLISLCALFTVLQEADFGTGPFILNEARASAADFTSTIWMDNMRIVSGRGSPEVDPLGFLFPLRPMVWMALLAALFGIMVVTEVLSVFNLDIRPTTNTFSIVRVFLQQGQGADIKVILF